MSDIYEKFGKNLYKSVDANQLQTAEIDPSFIGTGSFISTINQEFGGLNLVAGSFSAKGFIKTVPLTSNIQTAIDEVNKLGGGEVRLLSGTYTIGDNITLYSGISLVGSGIDITILEFSGNANGILAKGTASETIKDFKLAEFTLQNSNNSAGIDIDFAEFYRLESVKTTSCDQVGIRITGSKLFSLIDVQSTSNTGNGIQIDASNTESTQRFTLLNCFALSNGGIGYDINAGTNDMTWADFVACRASLNTGDGFDFDGSGSSILEMSLVGCASTNNSGKGFDINANTQRIRLVNCTVFNNSGGGYEIDGAGCSIIGCLSDGNIFDINVASVFVGNDNTAATSDPTDNYVLNETQIQSIGNLNQGTRTYRIYMVMKNTSGGALAAGDVVVRKAVATGDEVTTTTTGGSNLVYGMANETIADNAWGVILVEGLTTQLKVNGTTDIAIGDWLTTFTTAKIAAKASAGNTVFAFALEAYATDDSAGVIDALLVSPRLI